MGFLSGSKKDLSVIRISTSVAWGGFIFFILYNIFMIYFLYDYVYKKVVITTVQAYEEAINTYSERSKVMSDEYAGLASNYYRLLENNTELSEQIRSLESNYETHNKLREENQALMIELNNANETINQVKLELDRNKKELTKANTMNKKLKSNLEKKKQAISKAETKKDKKHLVGMHDNITEEMASLEELKGKVSTLESACGLDNSVPDSKSCIELALTKSKIENLRKKLQFMQAKQQFIAKKAS